MAAIRVVLPPTGLEPPLQETESALQATARRFATQVMRPAAQRLDRMTPEEVVRPESPYFEVLAEFAKLGLSVETLAELSPHERGRLAPLLYEELAHGDAGLTVAIGASMIPFELCEVAGRRDLMTRYRGRIGCWGITEPDHGSDMLDGAAHAAHPGQTHGRLNCVAFVDGDSVVVRGQKSAWVSNGPTAGLCALFCGYEDRAGRTGRCVVIVPLDLPGVSRGKPLDKLGQRSLPQGEIFFDNVRVPLDHLLGGPDQYDQFESAVLCEANSGMGASFVGVARAAYELAYEYAHQRRQGGALLVQHQLVPWRLFEMFRKIEAARALAHRVYYYNRTAPQAALQGATASKVTATQTAFEIASEAVQMLGGNGLTREYPAERLLRDARASMIEDGCNYLLSLKGGTVLVDLDNARN